jgi:gliding motility-associated-like protein
MGFGGVSPSIGIALDTWQNTNLNDPSYDHISIQANGVVAHGNDLAGPVQISATTDNVEDCQWHKLRITWDASGKWLRTYFDGVLRLQKQIDLVANIFSNDPNVYWGFSGATGGSVNLQQFCTALDPVFKTNFANNAGCEGVPVVFTDASESFAPVTSYNWSFGDGSFSTAANPPPHLYSSVGTYAVNLKIKGQDGCESDSTSTILVAANPVAPALQVFDTCLKKVPRLLVSSQATVNYQWQLDGVSTTPNQMPFLNGLSAGYHQVQVVASSAYGCGQPQLSQASFLIKPVPDVDASVQDGCADQAVFFQAAQNDSQTTIDNWQWQIDRNRFLSGQNVQSVFAEPGSYVIRLWAEGDNGCVSDTVEKSVKISRAYITANDTTVMRNIPSQLAIQSNGSVQWSPATGLTNPSVVNPTVTLAADQTYVINATTSEGCIAEDTIHVKVFTGPAVYVPSAFTPNGDGRNEVLLPVYVGIKELKRFAVYNRWGQMVFSTNDTGKGWDGKGAQGTFVWVVEVATYLGQPLILKGTATIIR